MKPAVSAPWTYALILGLNYFFILCGVVWHRIDPATYGSFKGKVASMVAGFTLGVMLMHTSRLRTVFSHFRSRPGVGVLAVTVAAAFCWLFSVNLANGILYESQRGTRYPAEYWRLIALPVGLLPSLVLWWMLGLIQQRSGRGS